MRFVVEPTVGQAFGIRVSERQLGIVQAVVATWLFSFVGPVAKLLAMGSGAIAFWRGLFTLIALLGVFIVAPRGTWRPRTLRHAFILLGTGLFTAGNWYFYILSAQVSSVAVAVVVLFTYPLFTALAEPWLFRERFGWWNAFSGAWVVVGVVLLVPKLSLADSTALGALYALFASLSLTVRNLISRRAVRTYPATTIIFYQMISCVVIFGPAAFSFGVLRTPRDLGLLLVLGAGLTAASQALFIASFRYLTTTFSSLLVSLQPVYTTAIAVVLLGEIPNERTLLGGSVILGAVVFAVVMNARGSHAFPKTAATRAGTR